MRIKNRHLSFTLLCCVTALVAIVNPVGAAGGVSVLDKLSDSTLGCIAPSTDITFQIEPSVAIDPKTAGTGHATILGAWTRGRTSDFHRGPVAVSSHDGGRTWSSTAVPFSTCAPGTHDFALAVDPWVSFGPDGTAYESGIGMNNSKIADPGNRTGLLTATSTDGGRTWMNVQAVIAEDNVRYFNDKDAITADPVKPGVAYVTWGRAQLGASPPERTEFARTTDGGKTWTRPTAIVNPGKYAGSVGAQIVVDPRTGTLYDIYLLFAEHPVYRTRCQKIKGKGKKHCKKVRVHPTNAVYDDWIDVVRSTDGGNTWSPPITIARAVDTKDESGIGVGMRTGEMLPSAAIDPTSGKLYVAWEDGTFSRGRYGEVSVSSSADGGATWSSPVQGNTEKGAAAFSPAIAVNANGVVGLTYYDLREATRSGATIPVSYWFNSSSDGGAHFGHEQHVAGPFDLKTALMSQGAYFMGDYQGLAADGASFRAMFAQGVGDPSNPNAVFTASINP